MKGLTLLISIAVIAAGCGQPAPLPGTASSSSSTTVTSTTTTVAISSSSTIQAPSTTTTTSDSDPPTEAVGLDRSVLTLGLEPGDTRPGRFRFRAGSQSDLLMTVEGRYWVTATGNVYSVLDVDSDLIAAEMARLLADLDAGTAASGGATPFVESLRNHYRGSEFQVGLTDLLKWAGLGGLSAEWAEQWAHFIEADGTEKPPELGECEDSIAAFDRAAARWIHDQPIDLTVAPWTFPEADFQDSLRNEFAAMAICESYFSPGTTPDELTIRLTTRPGARSVEVLLDDGLYTDADAELLLAVDMRPDETVGDLPNPLDPASLLTIRGSYLAAIGACGELPWIYSNFAAANTFHAPGASSYNGPTIFESGWFCEEEVPESRRDDSE